MQTWQILKGIAEGAYIEGDSFINQIGEKVVFNGLVLIGSDNINPFDTWEYAK